MIKKKPPLTKKEIAKVVSRVASIPSTKSEKIIDDMMAVIAQELQSGRNVKLIGFGSFLLRDKKSRIGRNPKTGAAAEIPARRVVLFRAGTKIKKTLREKSPSKKIKTGKSQKK